jgi:hypothetical protein
MLIHRGAMQYCNPSWSQHAHNFLREHCHAILLRRDKSLKERELLKDKVV